MNITLHIERLVLDGLPLSPGQVTILRAALEQELTRLLSERELQLLSGGAMPQLSVASLQLAASGQPAQWGRQIARSLCDGLAPVSSISPIARIVPITSTPPPAIGVQAPRLSAANHPAP